MYVNLNWQSQRIVHNLSAAGDDEGNDGNDGNEDDGVMRMRIQFTVSVRQSAVSICNSSKLSFNLRVCCATVCLCAHSHYFKFKH